MHMCFCVLLYFTPCMLYYCNTVGWAWWDWGLIWWLTILLQCFDTVGWITWPVKISSPNDLYCVEWDVKPYSTTTLHSLRCYIQMLHTCLLCAYENFLLSYFYLATFKSVQCRPGLTYKLTFLISDIRALWRSWLSARVLRNVKCIG